MSDAQHSKLFFQGLRDIEKNSSCLKVSQKKSREGNTGNTPNVVNRVKMICSEGYKTCTV